MSVLLASVLRVAAPFDAELAEQLVTFEIADFWEGDRGELVLEVVHPHGTDVTSTVTTELGFAVDVVARHIHVPDGTPPHVAKKLRSIDANDVAGSDAALLQAHALEHAEAALAALRERSNRTATAPFN